MRQSVRHAVECYITARASEDEEWISSALYVLDKVIDDNRLLEGTQWPEGHLKKGRVPLQINRIAPVGSWNA